MFCFVRNRHRCAGTIGGRAALWPTIDSSPIDLAPESMPASEIYALDGELQIGYAFKRRNARAVIWRGSAASALDLTPADCEESRAFDGAHDYQVGLVRARSTTAPSSGKGHLIAGLTSTRCCRSRSMRRMPGRYESPATVCSYVARRVASRRDQRSGDTARIPLCASGASGAVDRAAYRPGLNSTVQFSSVQ